MDEPCICVSKLTKSFSGRRVVDNLSFRVGRGEVFALLGHNGAGKSTTIDLILGLKAPEAGSATILGMDAAKNRKQVFRWVGVQLQHTQYQSNITVEEACIEYASLYDDPADYHQLLEQFGLEGLKKTFVPRLSGGERQKLSVVLALMGKPEIVFLDELTRQIAVVDGYLVGKKRRLSNPVLIKTIPETTVAAMQTRIESYDRLFEAMPEMGRRMEQVGCRCAVPEYCFTNYPEPGYQEEDILVEICEAVEEARQEHDGLYFRTLPAVQAACIFHRGSYRTFAESYEAVLRFIQENGYEIAGPIRESYIDGVWNQDDESGWLSEIQVPVRKK